MFCKEANIATNFILFLRCWKALRYQFESKLLSLFGIYLYICSLQIYPDCEKHKCTVLNYSGNRKYHVELLFSQDSLTYPKDFFNELQLNNQSAARKYISGRVLFEVMIAKPLVIITGNMGRKFWLKDCDNQFLKMFEF